MGSSLANLYYHHAAREAADNAVAAVLGYKQANGVFPESLQAAGFDARPAWRVAYAAQNGKPFLFYPAAFIAFDVYIYNFERRSWTYRPD